MGAPLGPGQHGPVRAVGHGSGRGVRFEFRAAATAQARLTVRPVDEKEIANALRADGCGDQQSVGYARWLF
jgi:hypothetical protein